MPASTWPPPCTWPAITRSSCSASNRASLEVGQIADLVLFDLPSSSDGRPDELVVRATFAAGQPVFDQR